MAPAVLARAGPLTQLIADRAYDANSLRSALREQGAEAVIPSTLSRKRPIPYDHIAYKQRNLIERMFGRLKDFRRIATRYDKLAQNYLAAVTLAATVTWWTN
jgi:transposase